MRLGLEGAPRGASDLGLDAWGLQGLGKWQ